MGGESQSNILIGRAGRKDASQIAAALYKSFVEYESDYTAEAFAATISTPEQIQARMKEGPIWIALWGQTIVGTVSAVHKAKALYIRGMAVTPAARGKSIGWALLELVEEFAVRKRCTRLFLSTTPFLARAIQLYKRYGFVRSDEGPQDLFGTPLFTMVKILKS
jgi:GNAT superfamily N-acetyltransferase